LDQDIKDVPILIDGSPQIVDLPVDAGETPHPGAICLLFAGDDVSVHWRRFAQISSTIAEPFHRSVRLHARP
jgi:hypothetical protein